MTDSACYRRINAGPSPDVSLAGRRSIEGLQLELVDGTD